MANIHKFAVAESTQLEVAYSDWLNRRAYLDNGGNFRIRAEYTTSGRSEIAPWNKLVKRTFTDLFFGLHDAAHEWQARRAS